MEESAPIKIAIVNDYEVVVTGLAGVLEPFAEQISIVELDIGEPATSDVDLLLFDTYGQPQGDALDVESLFDGGSAPVVVFSWNTEPDAVEGALKAGAAGYVSKSVSPEQLVKALTTIHEGEQVVLVDEEPFDVAPDEQAQLGRWPGDRFGLSPRESEVLALMCQGLSNQDITQRAFIGINTVKTHIRTLYRKIGVESRSQAVAWGLSNGFESERVRELPAQP